MEELGKNDQENSFNTIADYLARKFNYRKIQRTITVIKRHQTLTYGTTCMNPENVMLGEKKPNAKDHTLQDSIHMKHPEYINIWRQKVDQQLTLDWQERRGVVREGRREEGSDVNGVWGFVG